MSRRSLTILWAIVVVGWAGLTLVNLYRGQLNQDEGWYLYAAGLVADGQLPYVDFCYTQGPVLPFVYSLADGWVNQSGVLGGRLFTVLISMLSLGFAVGLAKRLSPEYANGMAMLLTACLLGLNVFHNYYSVVVKTYALAGLFVMAGLYCLTHTFRRGGGMMAFVAGILIALAVGTRASAIAVVPVVCLYLWWVRSQAPMAWFWFSFSCAASGAVLFLPFAMAAPESFWFSVVDYHKGREVASIASTLLTKGGFVALVIQGYLVVSILFFSGLIAQATGVGMATRYDGASGVPASFRAMLWLAFFAVSILHFIAPFPYHEYQVMIMPVLVVVLSVSSVCMCGERVVNRALWLCVVVVGASALSVMSSSRLQDRMMYGMDRLWLDMKSDSAIAELRKVSSRLKVAVKERGLAPEETVLLTQDLYLAVETGMKVPEGLEMGPFSYMPDFSTEDAQARHVMNDEMLRELIATTSAPVAAISGYGLSVQSPQVLELSAAKQRQLRDLLEERYDPLGSEIERFGQNDSPLQLYRLK